jgi:hypothetical protein
VTSILLLTPAVGRAAVAVRPYRVRLRDRLAARLNAPLLDRELADGVPPEAGAALSLRARRLLDPVFAVGLARSLHRVLREARSGESPRARMPVRRDAVLESADDVEALARRLLATAPLGVPGVARVALVLGDGTGPLFSGHADEDLGTAVRRARVELEIG